MSGIRLWSLGNVNYEVLGAGYEAWEARTTAPKILKCLALQNGQLLVTFPIKICQFWSLELQELFDVQNSNAQTCAPMLGFTCWKEECFEAKMLGIDVWKQTAKSNTWGSIHYEVAGGTDGLITPKRSGNEVSPRRLDALWNLLATSAKRLGIRVFNLRPDRSTRHRGLAKKCEKQHPSLDTSWICSERKKASKETARHSRIKFEMRILNVHPRERAPWPRYIPHFFLDRFRKSKILDTLKTILETVSITSWCIGRDSKFLNAGPLRPKK